MKIRKPSHRRKKRWCGGFFSSLGEIFELLILEKARGTVLCPKEKGDGSVSGLPLKGQGDGSLSRPSQHTSTAKHPGKPGS